MNLKRTDMEKISYRYCEKKGCKNKSEALFHTKFLCEDHFKEKKPPKEKSYRNGRKVRLSIEYWKEPFYMG